MPGKRPVFAAMLHRIARGEADGIISWHPDRLARNAVEGGQIIHYLDTGKLRDLQFPTFTYENSPQGKFMLMVMFGHSKYQVDLLSEHVKRGNRMKRELGWFPGFAPMGYLNIRSDSGVKVIGRDPERFPVVKKLWELFLTGNYSGTELVALATERFGLRAKRQQRRGEAPMNKSVLYRILRNPFYAGQIAFEGHRYAGSNHFGYYAQFGATSNRLKEAGLRSPQGRSQCMKLFAVCPLPKAHGSSDLVCPWEIIPYGYQ